jgi:uncharacterized protein involved in cysteine biosynthesis
MLRALLLAFDQLGDPAVRRVLWIGIGGSIAALAALIVGIAVLLGSVELVAIPWLDTAIDWLGGAAAVLLAVLFFPAVVGLITGLLLDRVARAVEARHYPGLAPARDQGLAEEIGTAARFFVVLVVANLLGLVTVYFIPILNAVAFLAINGYLLGREYWELVAQRRLSRADATELRRAHGPRVLGAGVLLALMLSIPVVNLLVPVVGTAFMVHIFQGVGKKT